MSRFNNCTAESRFLVMDGHGIRNAYACCAAHVADALELCDIRDLNYAEVDYASGTYDDEDNYTVDQCGTIEVLL